MDSDLMHSTGEWLAKDDTRLAVVPELLEFGQAIFALRRNFANPDLVADHFNGLQALDDFTVNKIGPEIVSKHKNIIKL